jgi:hypothetical protein
MAAYNYLCEKCKEAVRTLSAQSDTHKDCGGKLRRTPGGASSQQIETIDNGIMARRVEQFDDMQELAHERVLNDPRITRYGNN